jgi:hypothetical protein
MQARSMVIETLVTDLADREGGRMLNALRYLAPMRMAPVVRTMFVPRKAAVDPYSVSGAVVAEDEFKDGDGVLLPVQDLHYEFPALDEETLRAIFLIRASGRELLGRFRVEKHSLRISPVMDFLSEVLIFRD